MGNINKLLKEAFAEKKELEARLVKLNKAIEILGGFVVKSKKRHHNAATRKKMKDAWARRKAREDKPSMVLTVRKEPTIEERQAAAIEKLKQGSNE